MKTPKKWQNPDGSAMTCRVEDCDSAVKVAGMCGPHYSRSRKRDDTPRARGWYDLDGKRLSCLHLGCSDPIEARGLCYTHYRQALAGESPQGRKHRNKWVNVDGTRVQCSEGDCNSPVKVVGLCSVHYDRAWKSAHLEKTVWAICPIPGCARKKRAGALLCGGCRQSRWRYGLTDERYLEMMQPENRFCANPGCGATERLHMDHDHACCPPGKFDRKSRIACGECIRGWLCHPCNVTLGQMQESPERIRGLLTYLGVS